ncbi:MAG: DinB family protein [Desulfobacterales bacterium]|nr:DinB family protein [Desulfobacterales bacterium]
MRAIAQEIRSVIEEALDALAEMQPEDVLLKKTPDEWSKQEILGHLIDSAANNHQRFVRAAGDGAADFPTYDQEEWVRVQQYQQSSWEALLALWAVYNRYLCDLIERLPDDVTSNYCNIGTQEPVTLEFVVNDYLRHLRHHLADLI